jgi:Leucine-rich repeat (LRR) protein
LKLLEELSIRRCNFGDTDIKHILDLPKLYKLDVSCGNNITDFSFIPQMNLEKLDVSDSNITNETLRYFKDLTNLNLTDTKITDLTMLGDRTMDSLMTLNLSYCNLLENWDVLLKLKFDTLYISHSSIKKIDPRWNAKKTIMHTPWNILRGIKHLSS